MAITTTLFNGLGMGVSVLIILTLSNILIAALRKIIPNNIRIACFIVVIAGFVTIVDLDAPGLHPGPVQEPGPVIPLIVVNGIILGRAEAFSYKNAIAASTLDGIFQGLRLHHHPDHHVRHPRVPGRARTIMGGLLEINQETGQLVFGLGTAAGIPPSCPRPSPPWA